MAHLLLFEDSGGENYALAPLFDSGPEEQRAQVLFYGARADPEFRRNLLVAATLYQQFEDFVVAAGNLDVVEA
jgi:hypothetical protein